MDLGPNWCQLPVIDWKDGTVRAARDLLLDLVQNVRCGPGFIGRDPAGQEGPADSMPSVVQQASSQMGALR